jgi:hypothetical protein
MYLFLAYFISFVILAVFVIYSIIDFLKIKDNAKKNKK